jgi:phosphohistidine phosphatase
MKLAVVLRHGKSDWSTEVEDRARPLAKRGRKAAKVMGEFLTRAELTPDLIVVSPARRAADTVARVASAGGWQSQVRTNDLLYGADAFGLLDVMRAQPDDVDRLMLVGHEPASSEAVALLIGGGNVRLATAAVAGIELEVQRWAEIAPGCGHLVCLVPPRMLSRA